MENSVRYTCGCFVSLVLIQSKGRSFGGRKWQSTPDFLPGEFRGQRSLWATIHGITKSPTQLSK